MLYFVLWKNSSTAMQLLEERNKTCCRDHKIQGDGETLGKMNERLSMKEHFVNNYIESTANLLESRIGTTGTRRKRKIWIEILLKKIKRMRTNLTHHTNLYYLQEGIQPYVHLSDLQEIQCRRLATDNALMTWQ
jgi:hypothetical protein